MEFHNEPAQYEFEPRPTLPAERYDIELSSVNRREYMMAVHASRSHFESLTDASEAGRLSYCGLASIELDMVPLALHTVKQAQRLVTLNECAMMVGKRIGWRSPDKVEDLRTVVTSGIVVVVRGATRNNALRSRLILRGKQDDSDYGTARIGFRPPMQSSEAENTQTTDDMDDPIEELLQALGGDQGIQGWIDLGK